MGRSKHAIWNKIELIQTPGSTEKAKCNKCEYQCSTLVQRMKDHWGKCKGRKRHGEKDEDTISIPPNQRSVISVQTTSHSVQKQTEIQITRAIIALNAPFRAVENEEFKKKLCNKNFEQSSE